MGPPNYVKTFFAYISRLLIQKNCPKSIFWAPRIGVFLEEWPHKILGDTIAFTA